MKGNRGFTLIEVLVAISILAIISALLWQSMGSVTQSRERYATRSRVLLSANLALEKLSRDLQMAFLFAAPEFLGLTPLGEQRTKLVFIGTDQGDLDKVTFVTFSHLRYLRDTKESDQAEVSYFVESGPSETEEFEDQETSILKRRAASPPDAEPEAGGTTLNLLEGVRELKLRYYDAKKEEYTDQWDSEGADHKGKLPRAVEITLGVQDPEEESEVLRFQTVVILPMAPGPNDF